MAARRDISETGMAAAVNLYGRNEFRKQPEPAEIAGFG